MLNIGTAKPPTSPSGKLFEESHSVRSHCSNQKFVPVGTHPCKQAPVFFSIRKCELTAGSDEKKHSAPSTETNFRVEQ